MQRRPIRRGGILSAGYDPEKRQLDIEFDTHRIMRYEDVGQEVVFAWRSVVIDQDNVEVCSE